MYSTVESLLDDYAEICQKQNPNKPSIIVTNVAIISYISEFPAGKIEKESKR
jgi:hypothetical protein